MRLEHDILINGHGLLDAAPDVKYEFMEVNRETFAVAAMCQVLRVSSSGYYAWRNRRTSQAGSARVRANDAPAVEIRAIHKQNKAI